MPLNPHIKMCSVCGARLWFHKLADWRHGSEDGIRCRRYRRERRIGDYRVIDMEGSQVPTYINPKSRRLRRVNASLKASA